MLVYRIATPKFIDDLSGTGSKLYGGRWNEKGTAMVYFASSRALAAMELLVHLNPLDLQRDYTLGVFELPEDSFQKVKLPVDWKEERYENHLQKLGADFLKNEDSLLLQVPSVLVEEEFNYLMNPNHPDFDKIKMVSKRTFRFDNRLKN